MAGLILTTSLGAQAATENGNTVSISGGIAHPSYNAALVENPSGLIYNSKLKVSAETYAPARESETFGMGASILTGMYGFGLAAGVRQTTNKSTSLLYGGSYNIADAKTSFGISAESHLGNKNESAKGTDYNIGFLLGPDNPMRVGVTAFGLAGGPDEYATGVAYDYNRNFTFVNDFITNSKLNAHRVKPGVCIGNPDAKLSFSYGYDLKKETPEFTHMSKRLTIGGNIRINNSVNLQAYMNQQAFWSASLSMAL